jgi:hypothetical protein
MRYNKYKIISILLFILICLSNISNAATGSSSSTVDYVRKVNDLNYPAMYSDYPELRTIQSQTVSTLQGRSIDEETKNYVDIIIKILNSFNEIYSSSKSDSLESHEKALTKAETIQSDIESLEGYKEPREKYYPLLTKISLRKFFKNEAQYFSKKAVNERNTNNKIKYELNEARIYKNIGDPKYAEISSRAEKDKAKYEYDLNLIDTSIKDSTNFLNSAPSGIDNGLIPSIELFGQAYQTGNSITNAIKLSNYHEETQLTNQGEGIKEKISIIKNDASASVIKYIFIILGVYLIISLYFSWAIKRWRDEINNVDLGNDLLEGLILE